jgi:hypothetical protein
MIKGTLPKYENIRDTYTRVHEMIQSQQRIITSDMNRLVSNDIKLDKNLLFDQRKEGKLQIDPLIS